MLKAIELMRREQRLPVDVVVLCDGEEEILGTSACDHLVTTGLVADACVVFDAPMVTRTLPALISGSRGMLDLDGRVAANRTPLHSGLHGGAALNASHLLMDSLQAVIERSAELASGASAPISAEPAGWLLLESGERVLAGCGALPADDHAAEESIHGRSLSPRST